MDEEIERLIVSVRADTGAFRRDVAAMKGELEGPFADGVERAGRVLDTALARAVRTGKLGFDDLKRVALTVMQDIALSTIRSGIGAIGGSSGTSLANLIPMIGGLLGLPGRATGGLVAPGRPYMVGERGPELFVPAASGRIEPGGGGGAWQVRLSITINAPAGSEARALQQSARQIARAAKAALAQVD